MHLTIFGSSLVSSYWNGAATYYRGLLRALCQRGHRVTFCEPDAYGRQQNRDLDRDPPYARVEVYRSEEERERLLDAAFTESELVVKCSGVGVWDAELEAGVARRGDGSPVLTAFWDVDAPVTLARIAQHSEDPFREWVPLYDHVFTYGGGPPVVDAYLRFGARGCTPVYNGLDPDAHRPPVRTTPVYDLLFMGNRLPDREARVDEFFFRVAELCPERRFALGGEGWADKPKPGNVVYLGHVPTGEHNAVNASARLVLNIHRESMVENGWSPATRMFEAAGAAACQVTDVWRGIEEFFAPGREILLAEDAEEVTRLVRSVSDEAAGRIGSAARRRALRDHSYDRRAGTLDEVLSQLRRGVAVSAA
jgi:spore maturation protein CgeB